MFHKKSYYEYKKSYYCDFLGGTRWRRVLKVVLRCGWPSLETEQEERSHGRSRQGMKWTKARLFSYRQQGRKGLSALNTWEFDKKPVWCAKVSLGQELLLRNIVIVLRARIVTEEYHHWPLSKDCYWGMLPLSFEQGFLLRNITIVLWTLYQLL